VRDRANLVVRPRSEAISVRSSTAGGVEVVMTAGERLEGSHVVLCSGAIDTAAILLRSGLGGPLAGRGLQDHPAAVVDLGLRTASAGGLVTGVTSEHDGVQVLAMNHVGTDGPHAALVVSLLDPVGTGHVELLHNDGPGGDSGDDRAADDRDADDRAADEDDVVVVHPGVSHPHDASRLAAAVRRVGSLVATEPFQAIVADVGSAPFDASDAEVVEWLRRQPLIVRHASSTCATGAVVDERGRVLRDGSPASVDEHIRVCDASSFPSVPHGNPHLPVTMAAERLVAMWRTAVR
jgi:choline dehydrogenase-like flavoprotein